LTVRRFSQTASSPWHSSPSTPSSNTRSTSTAPSPYASSTNSKLSFALFSTRWSNRLPYLSLTIFLWIPVFSCLFEVVWEYRRGRCLRIVSFFSSWLLCLGRAHSPNTATCKFRWSLLMSSGRTRRKNGKIPRLDLTW
jgi:hypothetical protein